MFVIGGIGTSLAMIGVIVLVPSWMVRAVAAALLAARDHRDRASARAAGVATVMGVAAPGPSDIDDPAPRWMMRSGQWVLVLLVAGLIADRWTVCLQPLFDFVAHQFYEIPLLAAIRRPSQLVLARTHLVALAALTALGLLQSRRLNGHQRAVWAACCVAYAIRAVIWIAGGNLPLVPGDSSHYVEVASSVYRGEGPVSITSRVSSSSTPRFARARGRWTTGRHRSTPTCSPAHSAWLASCRARRSNRRLPSQRGRASS